MSRRERAGLDLGDGEVVAADDTRVGAPTLYAERLGLAGRPDHLLESNGARIPIEQKPRSRRLQLSHVLQVATQCVLVEEVYGVRPPHGVMVLAGGLREEVAFTPAVERNLLATMGRMRALLAWRVEPGPRWVAPKCRRVAFVKHAGNSLGRRRLRWVPL